MVVDPVFALLIGYAFGSIPFGLLLTKAAGLGDVRNIGSGNIGATNVLRTGNKGLAAATLLLDLAKGFAPVWIAWAIWGFDPGAHFVPMSPVTEPVPYAALGAVQGHCFPVWLKFKGGKGVATNAGVAFGIGWPVGLAYALVWLGLLATVRISSVAGMGAVLAAVLAAALLGYDRFVPVLAVIGVLVIWLHRANIARIKAGTEPKVGGRK